MLRLILQLFLLILTQADENPVPPGDLLAKIRWDSFYPPHPAPELNTRVLVFNEWVRQVLKCDPCAVKAAKDMDSSKRVSLIAFQDVPMNSTYFSIPKSQCLRGYDLPVDTPIGALISSVTAKLGTDSLNSLVLWLLAEKAKGKDSFWSGYIELLPRFDEMTSPIFWPGKQLKELLGGTPLYTRTIRDLESWTFNYRNLYNRVLSNEEWKKSFFEKFPKDAFNVTNYIWAREILASRSIWIGGERHLVPVADLANSEPFPGVSVHEAILTEKEDVLSVATRPFPSGEEVVENYGKPGWLYFLYHGFVADPKANREHDCTLIRADLFPMGENTPFLKERIQALAQRQFINYIPRTRHSDRLLHTFCEKSDSEGLIGSDLAQALFVSRVATERRQLKHGASNEEQIALIYGEIAAVIRDQLAQFPRKTEELEAKVSEINSVKIYLKASQGRELLASQYLLNEIAALKAIQEKAESRKTQILKDLGIKSPLSSEERDFLAEMRKRAAEEALQMEEKFAEEEGEAGSNEEVVNEEEL